MGEKTAISWTQHTANFWIGCRQVGPGCANCYAKSIVEKYGKRFEEVRRTKSAWTDVVRWNRAAQAAGKQEMVFTCSMSDFFIEDADQWRPEAWNLIKDTPNLIYQILTKRPELIAGRLPADWGQGYPNVWLGVSVENKRFLIRMDTLRRVPVVLRFISAEPLLQDVMPELESHIDGFSWVIVGGESGNGSNDFRPMPHEWARNIRDLCRRRGIKFFFKQSAAFRTEMGTTLDGRQYREYPVPRRVLKRIAV